MDVSRKSTTGRLLPVLIFILLAGCSGSDGERIARLLKIAGLCFGIPSLVCILTALFAAIVYFAQKNRRTIDGATPASQRSEIFLKIALLLGAITLFLVAVGLIALLFIAHNNTLLGLSVNMLISAIITGFIGWIITVVSIVLLIRAKNLTFRNMLLVGAASLIAGLPSGIVAYLALRMQG